jgi:hypothetical protein
MTMIFTTGNWILKNMFLRLSDLRLRAIACISIIRKIKMFYIYIAGPPVKLDVHIKVNSKNIISKLKSCYLLEVLSSASLSLYLHI